MIVRDSVRVKTDGKGSIRLVIMRDGNVIAANLEYSFKDGDAPISVTTEEVVTSESSEHDSLEEVKEGESTDGK